MNCTKTTPWVGPGHPDFKWHSGADVQATWRKYGWTPPSEKMTPPPPPLQVYTEPKQPQFLRRHK